MQQNVFFQKWNRQFEKIKEFLTFLQSNEEYLDKLEIKSLLSADNLEENHQVWMKLIQKYSGAEKKFFNKHYVPIDRFSYEYFIDISSPQLPIIRFSYVFQELNEYYRVNFIHNLDLMLKLMQEYPAEIIEQVEQSYKEKETHLKFIIMDEIQDTKERVNEQNSLPDEIISPDKEGRDTETELSNADYIEVKLNVMLQFKDTDFTLY